MFVISGLHDVFLDDISSQIGKRVGNHFGDGTNERTRWYPNDQNILAIDVFNRSPWQEIRVNSMVEAVHGLLYGINLGFSQAENRSFGYAFSSPTPTKI